MQQAVDVPDAQARAGAALQAFEAAVRTTQVLLTHVLPVTIQSRAAAAVLGALTSLHA